MASDQLKPHQQIIEGTNGRKDVLIAPPSHETLS
jgi:hypothetical protein